MCMLIHKGYNYRIYPTLTQIQQIAATLGCVRFVYNHFLEVRRDAWALKRESVTYSLTSSLLTALKRDPDHLWLAGADSMALQETLRDLDRAYKGFFEKRSGYPRFHSKHAHKQSYRTRNQNGCIRIEGGYIVLPKLGRVKAKISRLPRGRILNATVTCTASGKYFISLCVEEEPHSKSNAGGKVGIDLGIKDLYVDSNGNKVPNPKTLSMYEKKLRRAQRSLSRMIEANTAGYRTKGGCRYPIYKRPLDECSNIRKQRHKVALLHEKVYSIRTDALHKASSRLVSENQVIALESLNVKGMVRNHRLAKAISDASWSRFVSMIEYKAFEHGCTVVKVPTFFPSSQLCSSCGYRNPKVKDLAIRKWACPRCGAVHDRDHNAAKNVLAKGLSMQGT